MSRDSTARLLTVAFVLCLVCSILVSVAAVLLKGRQENNRDTEKKRNILKIAQLYDPSRPVAEQFSNVQPRILDLQNSKFVEPGDPAGRDAGSGAGIHSIPADRDIAGIRTRSRYREVYLVADRGRLSQIILPVHGKGLWSTMYGFIALAPDCTTVKGFGFYQHGETPGLGGEIDNPAWLAKWPGKMVYDPAGKPSISVIKGAVDTTSPDAIHQIDGLSGATLTSRGVENLLNYWLGEDGYGPFLRTVRKTGGALP